MADNNSLCGSVGMQNSADEWKRLTCRMPTRDCRVTDNMLQIVNGGVLPEGWTVDTLLSSHRSMPYNPDIANTFFRAGEVEAWGRGIERII